MRPKPLTRYRAPAFPTRAEAAADATLLEENLPAGWRGEGGMAGAVSFFLALSSAGCAGSAPPTGSTAPAASDPEPTGATPPVVAITEPDGTAATDLEPVPPLPPPAAPPAALAVAPIFDHGEGRGAVGCVVISPPVFLSEEEALSVIREELARHGIQLSKKNVELPGIELAQRREQYSHTPSGGLERQIVDVPGTAKALAVDATAPTHHVAVEMVSQQDYFELGGVRSGSSVQGYAFKDVATELAKRLKQQSKPGVYFGVFYDPVSHLERRRGARVDWQAAKARLSAESRTELRKQVKDFVGWLRQQGAM